MNEDFKEITKYNSKEKQNNELNKKSHKRYYSNNGIIQMDTNCEEEKKYDDNKLNIKTNGSNQQLFALNSNSKEKATLILNNDKKKLKNNYIRPNSTPILQETNNN